MNKAEGISGSDDRGANWGFLEDMASVGRLDIVLGEAEGSGSAADEALPEENLDQE